MYTRKYAYGYEKLKTNPITFTPITTTTKHAAGPSPLNKSKVEWRTTKQSLSLISYSVIPEAQKSKPITHYTQPEPKRSMALMAAVKKKKKKAVGNGGGKGSLNQAARAINSDEKERERWRARVERKNEKETVKILGI